MLNLRRALIFWRQDTRFGKMASPIPSPNPKSPDWNNYIDNQNVTLIDAHGTPLNLSLSAIDDQIYYILQGIASYAFAIGVTGTLMIVLAMQIDRKKARRPIFILNFMALFFVYLKAILGVSAYCSRWVYGIGEYWFGLDRQYQYFIHEHSLRRLPAHLLSFRNGVTYSPSASRVCRRTENQALHHEPPDHHRDVSIRLHVRLRRLDYRARVRPRTDIQQFHQIVSDLEHWVDRVRWVVLCPIHLQTLGHDPTSQRHGIPFFWTFSRFGHYVWSVSSRSSYQHQS